MQEIRYINVKKVGNGYTLEVYYGGTRENTLYVIEGFGGCMHLGACIIDIFDLEEEQACKK